MAASSEMPGLSEAYRKARVRAMWKVAAFLLIGLLLGVAGIAAIHAMPTGEKPQAVGVPK